MKRIIIVIGAVLLTVLAAGCSKILQEKPRSIYTPEYFSTEAGVEAGITSLYANLRYIYGNAYWYNTLETGTDEATYAQSADQNFKDMDNSGVGAVTPQGSRSDVLWNTVFPNINTANGIIQNGSAAGVAGSLLAEARFFRAFDYFLLVQSFGGVPLDLGAGPLKFNTKPVRFSVRNTVPEVYTKEIFPDLLIAVDSLPTTPRVTGGVTKVLAQLYLAKAYLTYAWWLQNPNNIPTYPAADRTDPDGHDAQYYFQQAYNIAVDAIENPGPFGLQPTYYDVHNAPNDRNNEVMLYADHTQQNELYNGASIYYSSASGEDNAAVWMMTWNYTVIRSSANTSWTSLVSSVQREAAQALGRPWIRMCPTIGAIENTFTDKTEDSRFDGTFSTVYRGNWNLGGVNDAFLYNANNMEVKPGDPILTFLSQPNSNIVYPSGSGHSNVGAGTLPGRADFVIGPNGISRIVYPGLWKLGEYRTDNGGGLGSPNGASTRPFNIAYFSQFFYVAAEAAVKGATTAAVTGTYANDGTARGLINVIRARDGMWKWDNAGDTARVADYSAQMVAATPANITINYILAERSREYYGEGMRWFDLIRTQTWAQIAGTYEICGSSYGDHTPETVTRTIPDYLYLRPIPLGTMDALDMTAAQKSAYQNPGY